MIQVTARAMEELCAKLSIDKRTLKFLGGGREDSDGIAYTYPVGKERRVLKILAFPEDQRDKLAFFEERVRFAYHLGENGIQISYPLMDAQGNLYETSLDNGHAYTAYTMAFCEGVNPESGDLTDGLVREWGRMIGKAHRVTGSFTGGTVAGLRHKEEIRFFTNWCKEPAVKAAWNAMERYLDTLPMGPDEYGFIHNDNHQRNILVKDGAITFIDFDCSCRQFFMQDIVTPAQGLMFDLTGGMMSPLKDRERLKRFFGRFLEGYETEHRLPEHWLIKLTTFVNYRRLLLFTCMQGWLNTERELKKGFLETIANPPNIGL